MKRADTKQMTVKEVLETLAWHSKNSDIKVLMPSGRERRIRRITGHYDPDALRTTVLLEVADDR